MAVPKITLYVDTVSPFAYMAYYLLRHDPIFKSCQITYVPIFLGGLMKTCGNLAPIRIKNKDKWIGMEKDRWATVFAIPMSEVFPPDFPPLTLGIMRALCALSVQDPGQERLVLALDQLFHEYWVRGTPTHQPECLKAVLQKLLGNSDAESVLKAAGTDGKRILTENTEKAFTDGAFGLPWIVATNPAGETEGFWGVDHMGQVLAFLGLERPGRGGWKSLL